MISHSPEARALPVPLLSHADRYLCHSCHCSGPCSLEAAALQACTPLPLPLRTGTAPRPFLWRRLRCERFPTMVFRAPVSPAVSLCFSVPDQLGICACAPPTRGGSGGAPRERRCASSLFPWCRVVTVAATCGFRRHLRPCHHCDISHTLPCALAIYASTPIQHAAKVANAVELDC